MNIMALAAAAAIVAAPVAATEADNPLAKDKVVMSLRGLELATVAGQRALAIRIDQAALAVCGDRLATVHLALEEQSRACQADVKAEIRSRIELRTADTGPGRRVQLRTPPYSTRTG